MSGVESAGNVALDLQTDAASSLSPEPQSKGCKALTAKGLACTMPAIFGTDLCMAHTPGLASIAGRKGGRPRKEKTKQRQPAARVAPDSPVRNLPDVKIESAEDAHSLLVETMNQLRRGEIDVQVANALQRMVKTALEGVVKVDLERRLAAVEAAGASK